MTIRIGINGFGRIGRSITRASLRSENQDMKVVHVNTLSETRVCAHLLQYDSVHGPVQAPIEETATGINVDGHDISFSAEKSPSTIPWQEKNVDVVFECTGVFNSYEQCQAHLQAGAPRVLVSAPCKNADRTIVFGVNEDTIAGPEKVISNASCTTNCLAPVTQVIHQHFTVECAHMSTVHSYTTDQRLLDGHHNDLRRARAAALSMIPTTTGAAKMMGAVIPELEGKISGMAIRVPTPNVSLIDVVYALKTPTSLTEVHHALQETANSSTSLGKVLMVTDKPLVSSDFTDSSYSAIVDSLCSSLLQKKLCKLLLWYDNETGFSWRMLDVAHHWVQKHQNL